MNLNVGPLKQNSNTAVLIAEALRKAIMRGTLKSEQPLRQDEIAAEFGVSKIPVREALFQLEAEGLVTFYRNRGAMVSALSPTEAHEIYLMRVALEAVALRQAIPRLKTADFIKAESILKTIDHETEPFKWSELNWEFHTTLYQAANLPRLMDMVRTLHVNVARYFVVYQAMAYRDTSQGEHYAILKACQQQDSETACRYLEQHLSAASIGLINYLEQSRA